MEWGVRKRAPARKSVSSWRTTLYEKKGQESDPATMEQEKHAPVEEGRDGEREGRGEGEVTSGSRGTHGGARAGEAGRNEEKEERIPDLELGALGVERAVGTV